jgi:hypothetical protein
MIFVLHSKNSYEPLQPITEIDFLFLNVDDVRNSLEAHTFTTCYGNSFTFLYVEDVRTSLEAHALTVYDGDRFTLLYVDDVRTSLEAHAFTTC